MDDEYDTGDEDIVHEVKILVRSNWQRQTFEGHDECVKFLVDYSVRVTVLGCSAKCVRQSVCKTTVALSFVLQP